MNIYLVALVNIILLVEVALIGYNEFIKRKYQRLQPGWYYTLIIALSGVGLVATFFGFNWKLIFG